MPRGAARLRLFPRVTATFPYYEDMVRGANFVFGLLVVTSSSPGLRAQACSTFDVASIRVNTSGVGGGFPELAPGGRRFIATNQLMVMLLMAAYDVSPLQILGIPSAFSQERYDIDATCEQPMTKEQFPHLLQELLAQRFHLSVHRELKEQPVYALVPGKGGPKFPETSHGDATPGFRQSGNRFTFTNADISYLVGVLSQVTGRKVVDKTELRGRYDFTLGYAPNRGGARREESNVSSPANGFPDSVFTAVREQLGLNLETRKAQVEFVIVDRIDPLIPN
jgi:uncharacterized protein (TIGR03435 family)